MNHKNFDIYRIDEKSEKDLFKNALVFFDTSALLDFYYYSEKTRAEIFNKVFPALKKRLYITPQTEYEYFKNRPTVLKKPIGSYENLYRKNQISSDGGHIERIGEIIQSLIKQTDKELEGQFNTLKEKTSTIDRHPYLDSGVYSDFENRIKLLKRYLSNFKDNFEEFGSLFSDQIQTKKTQLQQELKKDEIQEKFQKTISKTNALKHDEILELVKEGEVRYRNEIPPGYLDENDKLGFQKYGDLIFWKELLRESIEGKKDVMLIINDLKEDWWHYEDKDRPSSPRHELIKEFYDLNGCRFWMYSMNDFLFKSRKYLDSSIEEETIQDVESIKKPLTDEEEMLFVNWTFGYLDDIVSLSHGPFPNDTGIDFTMQTKGGRNIALQHQSTSKGRYTGLFIPLRKAYTNKNEILKKGGFDKLIYLLESPSLETANKLVQHIGRKNPQKIIQSFSEDFQIIIAHRDQQNFEVLYDSDKDVNVS